METILSGLQQALSMEALLAVFIGSVLGLIFGAIPGLTYSLVLVLLLPLTFAMPTEAGMGLLLGCYLGGMTGGSVSAILLGIPGTPSAAATVMDGYPMARRNEAGKALGTALFVSVFGGLFSLIIMVFVASYIADVALAFGPAEIFALVLFGLSTICGLSERSLTLGLVAGVLGLMLMTIGLDPLTGVQRLTFGFTDMMQGVNLVVAMIGLFAIPQLVDTFLSKDGNKVDLGKFGKVRCTLPTWQECRQNLGLVTRCSAMGTGIGAIPGAGGPIAAFLAYAHAKRFSKNPENFGKGEIAGVAAPESANNAVTGGTLIPLLSLGIPGDPATAIMLGGLLIHGLQPGPLLFQTNLDTVYAIYAMVAISYIAIFAVQLWGIRLFVKVLAVPGEYLAASILVLCAIGAFAIRNSMFDVYMMIGMGAFGYVLKRLGIPIAPVVLGMVLGEILDTNYRTALIMSNNSHATFFESWTAMILLGLTALTIITQVVKRCRNPAIPANDETTIPNAKNADGASAH
ncbi:tripartite tricarboxylate transporter permease [Telmatospirillum sp. J64-1]|uniref:tripartite tricarboxylate transporter permease n=1 Tax=Telmatospirillum sp. J64-1 TaxID=2502183 RepID=UPI00115DCE2C|nr:tripartite tricarboxylate transporter permease [Telmatospirillum sp. J64-1]